MDSLAREDNRRGLRRALKNLPVELDETYDEALKRIQGQGWRKAKRAEQVLSWISSAVRPLTIKEIQCALAIEPDDSDLDEDALPDEDLLTSVCAGLVIINRESNAVCLVHYTAQEYLERNRLNLFPAARIEIAKTCLIYLSFDAFVEGCCPTDDEMEIRLHKNHLLRYAANYWGYHARGDPEQNKITKELILKFLKQESKVACSTQVRYILPYQFEGYTQHFPKGVSALQIAASFGLKETARALIEADADIKAKDCNGMTCLHSAAANGYQDVVELLLDRGIDAEAKDNSGMTALHWAATNGHEAVLMALFEKRVDINAKTVLCQTALFLAAWKGHTIIVRLLLEKGADPNLRETKCGQVPLTCAAWHGHEAVVKLLLEYGADLNAADTEFGLTPLSQAAENGRVEVVRLLLDQDGINPNSKDLVGRTPLLHAVRTGREAVVRLLLEREDVDTQCKDEVGWKPSQLAGERGHESIVRLLSAVTTEQSESHSTLPLFEAVENGNEAAVRLLLKHDDHAFGGPTG